MLFIILGKPKINWQMLKIVSSEPLADFSGNNSRGAPVSNSCKLTFQETKSFFFFNSDRLWPSSPTAKTLLAGCTISIFFRCICCSCNWKILHILSNFCILAFYTLCNLLSCILAFCTLCNFFILYSCVLQQLPLMHLLTLHEPSSGEFGHSIASMNWYNVWCMYVCMILIILQTYKKKSSTGRCLLENLRLKSHGHLLIHMVS